MGERGQGEQAKNQVLEKGYVESGRLDGKEPQ